MKLSNTRSVVYLFVAMLVSSVVIGSVCRTKFVPVPSLDLSKVTTNSVSATKSNVSAITVTKNKYAPVDVEMKLIQIAEHTWYVQGRAGMATDNAGFISNAGVVITDAGVVIFDALGSPSLANKLLSKIKEITDKPIVKVIVSHYHADHIYGLQVFKEQGTEIIAPDGVYKYLDSETASSRLEERRFSLEPWVNDKTLLVVPDRIIDNSETFNLGNIDFTISYVGSAHSDGDLTMYVETDKVLFTGDLIFEGRVPFIGSNKTKHWLATLEKMETQKLNALVPGHGPSAKEPDKAISMTRKYLAFLRDKMGVAVEEMTDFADAYNAADWSDYKDMPAFDAANRKNAFQVYLSLENE